MEDSCLWLLRNLTLEPTSFCQIDLAECVVCCCHLHPAAPWPAWAEGFVPSPPDCPGEQERPSTCSGPGMNQHLLLYCPPQKAGAGCLHGARCVQTARGRCSPTPCTRVVESTGSGVVSLIILITGNHYTKHPAQADTRAMPDCLETLSRCLIRRSLIQGWRRPRTGLPPKGGGTIEEGGERREEKGTSHGRQPKCHTIGAIWVAPPRSLGLHLPQSGTVQTKNRGRRSAPQFSKAPATGASDSTERRAP